MIKKTYSLVKSLIKLKFHSSNFTYVNKNIASYLLEEIGLQKQIVHFRVYVPQINHCRCSYLYNFHFTFDLLYFKHLCNERYKTEKLQAGNRLDIIKNTLTGNIGWSNYTNIL